MYENHKFVYPCITLFLYDILQFILYATKSIPLVTDSSIVLCHKTPHPSQTLSPPRREQRPLRHEEWHTGGFAVNTRTAIARELFKPAVTHQEQWQQYDDVIRLQENKVARCVYIYDFPHNRATWPCNIILPI